MSFYRITLLRKLFLPLLKIFAKDISIQHPWVRRKKVRLNSFKHKGYWFHGKNRERRTMELFSDLIVPGSTVVEVGGHIGFISIYFDHLVGPKGRVFVFEPGSNNLPYIRSNVSGCPGVTLIEKAVGAKIGVAEFYEDSLTGQNNSLVRDFDGYKQNAKNAFVKSTVQTRSVSVVTLDSILEVRSCDFIKIDAEGYEWGVICGAKETIKSHPAIMVEVQANEYEIYAFFSNNGYFMFNDSGVELLSPRSLEGNVFCLHKDKHSKYIDKFSRFHPCCEPKRYRSRPS
jgi:FkbM family methyltransferase